MTEVGSPATLAAEEHGTLRQRHTATPAEVARFRAMPASAVTMCPSAGDPGSPTGVPPTLFAAVALRSSGRLLDRDKHRRKLVAVHGLQRLRLHQPLAVGEEFTSAAVVHSVRTRGASVASEVSVRFAAADGAAVAESTSLLVHAPTVAGQGVTAVAASASPTAPPTSSTQVSSYAVTRALVAEYAEVSGDGNPIHLSPTAARAAGFENVLAHGMLTFALAEHHVASYQGESRIADLQLRFRRPLFVPAAGAMLTVSGSSSPAGAEAPTALALTATDGSGAPVATGRAGLLPPAFALEADRA